MRCALCRVGRQIQDRMHQQITSREGYTLGPSLLLISFILPVYWVSACSAWVERQLPG